jgi:pyocin large subunit-like protein
MSATKTLLFAAAAALVLSACDNGPSAVAAKPTPGSQLAENAPATSYDSASPASESPRVDHRQDPVKLLDGKPIWSASRKFSAAQNAQRAFDRNGHDFGADNLQAFVQKAHAFVEHPPKGTLTMTRKNGDTLFYDPKGNVFAVASKDGAPRTMFHPDDGRAYWEEQKAREAKRQTSAARRGRDDDA